MPRRSSGSTFQIDTGLDIGPFLTKSLIEAIEPKGTRKQRQEQEALAKLAELQPMVSKLPETEKKDFYNRFFQAYGVYKAPWIRGMFGAGEEPVLPLPTGAQEITRPMTGMFGRKDVKGVYVPQVGPFKFTEAPLLSEQKKSELLQFAKAQGYDEEETNALIEAATTGVPKSAAAIQANLLKRADRLIGDAMAGGKTREQAIETLPPTLKRHIQEHEQEFQTKESLRKYQAEAALSLAREREERPKIAREREARFAQQFKATMDLAGRKQAVVEQQAQRMLNLKTIDMQTRNYINIMKEKTQAQLRLLLQHNQQQMKFRETDPNFVPDFRDDSQIAGNWDDLYARVMSMQGVSGAAPEVAPPLSEQDAAFDRLMKRIKGGK